MPKAKRFASQRPRGGPLSNNASTERLREIAQSKIGLDAELQRIATRYRTSLSRTLARLRPMWISLSEAEKVMQEEEVRNQNQAERDMKFAEAKEEWEKLLQSDDSSGSEEEMSQDSDSEEIVGDNEKSDEAEEAEEEDEQEEDDDDEEEEEEEEEVEEEEEDTDDPEFDDGDVDVSDNEDLIDADSNRTQPPALLHGFKEIMDTYRESYFGNLKKYEKLAKRE